MEAKLDALMVEVCESRKELMELEEKFSSSLSEMKREVNATQERTAQQFSKRIGSSTYEFKRKGNEYQFNFNCGIEDHIDAAKVDSQRSSHRIRRERRR